MDINDTRLIERVIEYLQQLIDAGPGEGRECWGLCGLIGGRFGHRGVIGQTVVSVLAKSWPHYTGNFRFPIPCERGGDPGKRYSGCFDKWGDHAYGDLRRDLCQHMIDLLEELL